MPELTRKIAIVQRTPVKTPLRITIAVSNNPRICSMAKETRRTIHAILSNHYTNVTITYVDTMADLQALVATRPDLVVLGMKLILLDASAGYAASPKVWLSDYLAKHAIAHTGSDRAALMLQRNKPLAKQLIMDAGLQSAAYFTASRVKPVKNHALSFPLFVKPSTAGKSRGIDAQSVVYTDKELQTKIDSIHAGYQADALIEAYLPGREFSVAVIRQPRSRSLLAMPIEITSPADAKGNSVLTKAIKTADIEQVQAVTDLHLRSALNTLAIEAFKALGARDYGRIDIRLDAAGIPHFLEANLMPGLSDHGYLLRCFAINRRTSYEYMILSIIRLALERRTRPRRPVTAG